MNKGDTSLGFTVLIIATADTKKGQMTSGFKLKSMAGDIHLFIKI